MTTFQIVALAALAVTMAVQFFPALAAGNKKIGTMEQVEQVIAIKESSTNPEVIAACKSLLQALLL